MKNLFYVLFTLFFLVNCLPMEESGRVKPPISNPCNSKLDCNDDKICTSKNFCADCEEDEHCDEGLICSNYTCKILGIDGSCTKHNDCNNVPNKPKCDINIKSCVACLYGIQGDDSCPGNLVCSEKNECLASSGAGATHTILGTQCSGTSVSMCKYNASDSETFWCKCSKDYNNTNKWVITDNNTCSKTLGGNKTNRHWCEYNHYCINDNGLKCKPKECLSSDLYYCPTNLQNCSASNQCVASANIYEVGSTCISSNFTNPPYQCKYYANSTISSCKCAKPTGSEINKWVILTDKECKISIGGGTSSNNHWCERNNYCVHFTSLFKCSTSQCYKDSDCTNNLPNRPYCDTDNNICEFCLYESHCSCSPGQTPECYNGSCNCI